MSANRQLDLEEDEAFEKAEWRVQRIGWLLWALVLIAGLAGLLGTGPLSNAQATTPDGDLTVSYDRFLHYHQPAQLEIELRGRDQNAEGADLKVSQTLLNRIQIHRIQPEPERRQIVPDGVIYSFARSSDAQTCKIVFHIEFERMGKSVGGLGLSGNEPVYFNQFVYP